MSPKSTLVWVAAVLSLIAVSAGAKEKKFKERYIGNVIDTAGAVPGRSSTWFYLMVSEFTPDERAQELAAILAKQGQKALVDELDDMEAGRVRFGSRLSYHASMIRTFQTPGGGRVIRVVTDRPLGIRETLRSPRSLDYSVAIIELQLDAEGKGEGIVLPATEVKFNEEGELEIESLGIQPFKLVNVKPE